MKVIKIKVYIYILEIRTGNPSLAVKILNGTPRPILPSQIYIHRERERMTRLCYESKSTFFIKYEIVAQSQNVNFYRYFVNMPVPGGPPWFMYQMVHSGTCAKCQKITTYLLSMFMGVHCAMLNYKPSDKETMGL